MFSHIANVLIHVDSCDEKQWLKIMPHNKEQDEAVHPVVVHVLVANQVHEDGDTMYIVYTLCFKQLSTSNRLKSLDF